MQIATEVISNNKIPIKLPEPLSYCYVVRPEETKTMFPQHDECDFPKYQNEFEAAGKWNVMVGLKGKTNEVSFDVDLRPMGK